MQDPVLHVVVDTNILGDFLCPQSTKAAQRVLRSQTLLASVFDANWPSIKLYTPAICIAEAIGILDKFRFCTWGNELKQQPQLQLTRKEYAQKREALTDAVATRAVEQLEHEPMHVLLAGLISPINARYQIRRKKKSVRPPMGAADCLIAAMSIQLVGRAGRDSVLLVTGDQRMADVIRRASSVKMTSAQSLGLVSAAKSAGFEWHRGLYPKVLNIGRATDAELQRAFGGWPLPTSKMQKIELADLTVEQKNWVADAWREVSNDRNIKNVDNLPYSTEIEDVKVRLACRQGIYVSNSTIYKALLSMRKRGQLSN